MVVLYKNLFCRGQGSERFQKMMAFFFSSNGRRVRRNPVPPPAFCKIHPAWRTDQQEMALPQVPRGRECCQPQVLRCAKHLPAPRWFSLVCKVSSSCSVPLCRPSHQHRPLSDDPPSLFLLYLSHKVNTAWMAQPEDMCYREAKSHEQSGQCAQCGHRNAHRNLKQSSTFEGSVRILGERKSLSG